MTHIGETPETTRAPLIFQITVAAPADDVFKTFFDQPERWLCRSGSTDPEQGGEVRLCWGDGCVEGRVLQYDAPNVVRFTWHYEGDPMPETMVVMSTQPGERDGKSVTAIEVEHYGFGSGTGWEAMYMFTGRAWAGYLKNLRSVIENGADLREDDE